MNKVDEQFWANKRSQFERSFKTGITIDCAVIPLSKSPGKINSGNYFVSLIYLYRKSLSSLPGGF